MIEVRCKGCGKLLGYFKGKGDIKCPKVYCGGRNIFDTETEELLKEAIVKFKEVRN